jgi:hypothetical protein
MVQENTLMSGRWDWDRIGISLSTVCVAHCILTPLAFLLLPMIGYAAGEHTHVVHWIMLTLLLPVALIAFWRGYRHHGKIIPLILAVVGMTLIVAALLVVDRPDQLMYHYIVNVIGSVFLLTGHVQNRRCHAQCGHQHH